MICASESAAGINTRCSGRASEITWRVDNNTPSTVYYGSYKNFNMGGPIRVCSSIRSGRCIP